MGKAAGNLQRHPETDRSCADDDYVVVCVSHGLARVVGKLTILGEESPLPTLATA